MENIFAPLDDCVRLLRQNGYVVFHPDDGESGFAAAEQMAEFLRSKGYQVRKDYLRPVEIRNARHLVEYFYSKLQKTFPRVLLEEKPDIRSETVFASGLIRQRRECGYSKNDALADAVELIDSLFEVAPKRGWEIRSFRFLVSNRTKSMIREVRQLMRERREWRGNRGADAYFKEHFDCSKLRDHIRDELLKN